MAIPAHPQPFAVTGQADTYWDDLTVGDVLRAPGLTITETHLVQWAGLTGDWVSLHLDAEYAAQSRFGQRLAHGPLTLSVSLGLMTQTGVFGNVLAWLGLDDVRAVAPVYLADTIRSTAELVSTRASKRQGAGIWTLTYRTVNQDDATVMTFTSSFLVQQRSG